MRRFMFLAEGGVGGPHGVHAMLPSFQSLTAQQLYRSFQESITP